MFPTSSRFFTPAAAAALAFGMLWSMPAHAYLDPATGSILLQGLLAGVAGLMIVVRLYWRRARAFLRGLVGGSRPLEETEPAASQEPK